MNLYTIMFFSNTFALIKTEVGFYPNRENIFFCLNALDTI